jgi:glycosyltransferase involved in cell wall biosynthesis
VSFPDKDKLFSSQKSSLLYKTALAGDNTVHYLVNGPTFSGRFFGIEFVSRHRNPLLFLLFAIYYIRKHSVSVVIVHGTSYYFSAALLSVFTGVPVIIQYHSEKTHLSRKAFLMKWTRRFISGYFFSGRESAESFIEAGLIRGSNVCEVTEGTTDFNYFALPAGRATKIVAVSRLVKHKDVLTLFKALALLIKTTNNFTVDLYYSANEQEKELKEFAVSHGLSEYINFLGKVEHCLLETALNSADVFVSCSHHEGSGYALIEALACGVFPVVSAIPPHAYLLRGLEWQRMFETGNERQLADMLAGVIAQAPELRMRSEIRRHFESRASASAIATQVNSALNELAIQ